MQKQISNWRKELSILAEIGTGSDNGKLNRKKRKIFKKYSVSNAREVEQLTETLKQKVQAKAQRIRRCEKGKSSIVRIRSLKKTLKILQKPRHKEYRAQRISLYGRRRNVLESLWREEAKHNERAEWTRREQKRKISLMDWRPIQISENAFHLLKAQNWKSPGSDQMQNYWLKAFLATHRHIKTKIQCNNRGTGEGT